MAPQMADRSPDEQIAFWRDERHMFVGLADDVIPQIAAYQAAGAAEIMFQWFNLTDLDGIHAVAEQLLPRLKG
jgi:alkanesulfonate monooxygenase SsuD/methylene tetrahydromethanopterin reductase-like flavin-dependent oxidoreductase (luciferase family)